MIWFSDLVMHKRLPRVKMQNSWEEDRYARQSEATVLRRKWEYFYFKVAVRRCCGQSKYTSHESAINLNRVVVVTGTVNQIS